MDWIARSHGLGRIRSTFHPERTLLVVAHHAVALHRLLDAVPSVEADPRVQIVFTVPPGSLLATGAHDALSELDALVIPWAQARASRFDAAVAAGFGALDQVRAPILSLGHGNGIGKTVPRMTDAHFGPEAPLPACDAIPGGLVSYGRVVPAVIGVAHREHRALLTRAVPETAEVSRVVGDPCFDRLLASVPHRAAYRTALGVGDGRLLVLVSSTHGANGLFGRLPDLPARLVAQLPADRYRVVAAPHPVTWEWHGRRQLLAWYAKACRAGLGLLAPHEDWRAAMVAADLVVGDHSALSLYAAGLGRALLLGTFPEDDVVSGSPMARLGRVTPRLDAALPLEPQVARAIEAGVPARTPGGDAVTSAPGRAQELLRQAMYELMRLEPPRGPAPRSAPVPLPRPLLVERSAAPDGPPVQAWTPRRAPHTHAELTGSSAAELRRADVIVLGDGDAPTAAEVFARYPGCLVLAAPTGPGCRVVTRTGEEVRLAVPAAHRAVAASLVHDWLTAGGGFPELDPAALAAEVRRIRPLSSAPRPGPREAA